MVPIIVTTFITIIAIGVFTTLLFLLLLSPWLCWCSSCHYYWCWHDCRCYCYHFSGIVVIIASLFCSFRYLLCVITFLVLSLLFLHHCHFCYFVAAVFFVVLAGTVVVAYRFMLLPLLLDGCCFDDCCGSQIGCYCCCCCWIVGPTFYMESKNLSAKWIPYISANSATHPWLPHKLNSKHSCGDWWRA